MVRKELVTERIGNLPGIKSERIAKEGLHGTAVLVRMGDEGHFACLGLGGLADLSYWE